MQKIPQIIHQIMADNALSAEAQQYQQGWQQAHPGWEVRVWDVAQIRQMLSQYYDWFVPMFDAYLQDEMRLDAGRYFILYHFGGVVLDAGFECQRPLTDLLQDNDLLLGLAPASYLKTEYGRELEQRSEVLAPKFLASIAEHDFWSHVFELLTERYAEPQAVDATGTFLLHAVADSYDGRDSLQVVPAHLLHPLELPVAPELAYAVYHSAASASQPAFAAAAPNFAAPAVQAPIFSAPPSQPQIAAPPAQAPIFSAPPSQPQIAAPPAQAPVFSAPPSQPQIAAPPAQAPIFSAPPSQPQIAAPPAQAPIFSAPPSQPQIAAPPAQAPVFPAPPSEPQQKKTTPAGPMPPEPDSNSQLPQDCEVQVSHKGKITFYGRFFVGSHNTLRKDIEQQPLVSCLMLTKDRFHLAQCAIECFLRQTYEHRELVIVDTSADKRLGDYIHQLNDARIRHVWLRNQDETTLGELRNLGVDVSNGEYVACWDDDDLSHPERLSVQLTAIQSFGADACFLMRQLLWWPKREGLATSRRRAWENSSLYRKASMCRFPALNRGEDTVVGSHMLTNKRCAIIDTPDIYAYVCHERNTVEIDAFEAHWAHASQVFEPANYIAYLSGLNQAFPIQTYLDALAQHN